MDPTTDRASARQTSELILDKLNQLLARGLMDAEALVERLKTEAMQAQEPPAHHLCGDDACEPCLARQDAAFRQGVAEANDYYESIPGVTGLREKYALAQEKVSISKGVQT